MSSQSSPVAGTTALEPFEKSETGPADAAVLLDPPPPYSETGSANIPEKQGEVSEDIPVSESKNDDANREADSARIGDEESSSHNSTIGPGTPPSADSGTPSNVPAPDAADEEEERMVKAWAKYKKLWDELENKAANAPLRWSDIPWPMVDPPSGADSLTNGSIAKFILSPNHSQGNSPKERIREAQSKERWDNDHFERHWLPKCVENEREEIKNGAGFVMRCLNEFMSVQSALVAS